MKSYLMIGLAGCAILFAGCEDPCKVGLKLKGDMMALETNVSGTIVTPDAFDLTCQNLANVDDAMLTKGAAFATHVANDYLTTHEDLCERSHTEYRCGIVTPGTPGAWAPDPWHTNPSPIPGPGYGCHNIVICDLPYRLEHHKDGYEQALQLSANLTDTDGALKQACLDHTAGDTVKALVELAKAKASLHDGLDNAETVLQKVGCYSRRGD